MEKQFDELSKEEHVALMKANNKDWVRSLQESLDLRRLSDEVEGPVEGPHDLEVKQVHRVGGREGEGEYVKRTYAVKDANEVYFYFEIYGHYDSYEGTEWDETINIVEPYQVMVTKYRVL